MNRKIMICIYALLFLSLASYPQDVKKVIQQFNNNSQITEEFFVLKTDNSIKHGNYVKYSTRLGIEKFFQEYGSYNQNIKNGVWLYFNSRHPKNPLSIIGEFKNGRRTGQWAYFYPPEIKDTNLINLLGFNKSTNIISSNENFEITIDTSGLKLAALGDFDEDHKIGEWRYYSKVGELIKVYDFSGKKEIYSLNDSILLPGGFWSFQEQLTQSLIENAYELKSLPTSTLAFEIITNDGDLYVNNLTPLIENNLAAYIEQAIIKMPRYWVDFDPLFEKFSFVVNFSFDQKEQGSTLNFKSFKPSEKTKDKRIKTRVIESYEKTRRQSDYP